MHISERHARMQVLRGECGEPRLSRGWTALCLLSLLPSGFTNPTNNQTSVAMESSTLGIFPSISTTVFNQDQDSTTPSTHESTSPHSVPGDRNKTTPAISETMVNFTATSEASSAPGTTNSSAKSQTTSPALKVTTTADNISTSEMASIPSTIPVNFSYYSPNSIIPETTSPTGSYTFTSSSVPSTIKGEIKCSGIREMRLAQGICLELSEASSCEEFKKGKGEGLTQILCGKEEAYGEAEAGVCSLLLAQSEVKPECLLLVLVNKTELVSKLQLMEMHQSDLRKLGIQGFREQDVGSHQSYSRKTLIALVTSGILLAILGTTGYFLMNRHSWSPTGERLVSFGVQGKANEEDNSFLGKIVDSIEKEDNYKNKLLCALTLFMESLYPQKSQSKRQQMGMCSTCHSFTAVGSCHLLGLFWVVKLRTTEQGVQSAC